MKLPTVARTRKVKDLFDEKRSFKDLTGECNKANKHALSDQSNKLSRAAVNSRTTTRRRSRRRNSQLLST